MLELHGCLSPPISLAGWLGRLVRSCTGPYCDLQVDLPQFYHSIVVGQNITYTRIYVTPTHLQSGSGEISIGRNHDRFSKDHCSTHAPTRWSRPRFFASAVKLGCKMRTFFISFGIANGFPSWPRPLALAPTLGSFTYLLLVSGYFCLIAISKWLVKDSNNFHAINSTWFLSTILRFVISALMSLEVYCPMYMDDTEAAFFVSFLPVVRWKNPFRYLNVPSSNKICSFRESQWIFGFRRSRAS